MSRVRGAEGRPFARRTGLPSVCLIALLLGEVLLRGADSGGAKPAGQLPPPPPPPLPPVVSPVAFFRSLLATHAEGRAQILAGRSERQRQVLEAKVAEYESMAPGLRESRLLATELRYFLKPLLLLEPAERAPQLALVPEGLRPLVDERLREWDAFPAEVRSEMLAFDAAVQEQRSRPPREGVPSPPAVAANQMEDQLARWRGLDPGRREAALSRFERFFEMPLRQQERALGELSEEDRRQVEEALAAFSGLSREQRRLCLTSFRKFASLSAAERASFLRSADRWREMTAAEREQWRRLVAAMPPMPPGLEAPPPLPPPLPSGEAPRLVTNSAP